LEELDNEMRLAKALTSFSSRPSPHPYYCHHYYYHYHCRRVWSPRIYGRRSAGQMIAILIPSSIRRSWISVCNTSPMKPIHHEYSSLMSNWKSCGW